MNSEWKDFRYRFARIVRGFIIFLIFLAPLVLLGWSASRWNFLPQEQSEEQVVLPQEEGKVSPNKTPNSFPERKEAPSIALLPSRTDLPAGAPAPPVDKRQIILLSKEFLNRWENYTPPLLSGERSDYSSALDPLVASEGAVEIFERSDVSTLEGLCPEISCLSGSSLIGEPDLRIIDYSGREAYVVGYGLIRIEGGNLGGQFYKQAYALLLERSAAGWLVSRAAAETLAR